MLAYAVVFTITPSSLNEIKTAFNATRRELSYLPAVMMLGFFIACIVGGRLADKMGKFPLLVLGTFLMSAGAAVFVFAPSFYWTVFASLFTGIGGGISEGLAMAAVSDNTTEKNRTLAMNVSQIVFCIGAVGTPLVVALGISHHVPWRYAYAGASIVCGLVFILTLFARKLVVEKISAVTHSDSIPFKKLVTSPLVIILSVSQLLYVGAECGFANWIAAYFKDEIAASGSISAAMVAVFWGGIATGRGITAITSRYLSNEAIVIWAFFTGAIAISITLLISAAIPAAVFAFIAGIAYGPIFPTVLSVAGERFKSQTGSVFGLIVASGSMGALLFPAAIGMSSDAVGLRTALWICPVISIIGFILFTRLRNNKQPQYIERPSESTKTG